MKFLALIGLAAIGSAVAYCPNLCSGHGKCGAQDTCTCYSFAGTTRGDFVGQYASADQDAAWTGADCSQRTCPKAYSFSGATPYGLSAAWVLSGTPTGTTLDLTVPSADYTVLGTATYSATAAVKFESFSTGSKLRTGSQLVTIKTAFQTAATTIAITTYETITAIPAAGATVYTQSLEDDTEATISYSAITGDFGQWDANGAHDIIECAGQGICDRSTGECKCFPGYEGEACTRTACPNQCSGHGTCLSAARLNKDAQGVSGTVYNPTTAATVNNAMTYNTAWDSNKHYGCKCDIGFRGPDCSLQECPSDYDPLNGCGGGQCNTGGSYINKAGVSTLCSTLTNNLSAGSDCASGGNIGTQEQRDCSGRGICDYETGVCKCFSGFFGDSCNVQTILV